MRGMRHQCPNCGAKTLFDKGLTLNRECRVCGMKFDRDEGFFLGSMTINYGVTVFGYLLLLFVLVWAGILPANVAFGLALAGAVLFPILFYRTSRSLWLMAYFYFLPHELPRNRGRSDDDEEE
ncbi:MAG: DUF983 domain-containing protein [Opitutales bacterium]